MMSEEPPTEDLEDLYENAPCGYLSLRPDGRIVKANATLSHWTGFAPEQLVGKRLLDLLNIAGRMFYETHFSPLLRMQGYFNEVALDFVTASGERLPILANAVVRRDSAGKLLFIRLTVFKAAERRRYERELVDLRAAAEGELTLEREISQLREQFIAVLGHDLRNPLASIEGAAQLLLREPQTGTAIHILGLMQRSVVRMSGLIANVLDFARGRLGGGITLDRNADQPLEPVLQQVVAELRTGAPDHVIQTDFALAEPVNCDRSRIGQLVSNLLGNALTHGASGEPVRIHASTKDGILELWVANAGKPIAAEAMEHLFQPFFRGQTRQSQQGLGLGLYIASEIAKAHGGTLMARSSEEETRFTFNMPLT
jgi:phosphoserine phosphatase RsbU/P